MEVTVPRKLTQELVECQKARSEEGMQDILLSALYRALVRLGFESELWFELEGHGRNRVPQLHVERTIGWFTEFRLLRLSPSEERHGNETPCIQVVDAPERTPSAAGRIRFNYLGELGLQENDFFVPLPAVWLGDVGGRNRMNCRLCADMLLVQGQLQVHFTFAEGDALCTRLSDAFLDALAECVRPFWSKTED